MARTGTQRTQTDGLIAPIHGESDQEPFAVAGPVVQPATPRKLRERSLSNPAIIDDFAEAMPITRRELDAIETYLGSLIDELLKGS